MTASPQHPINLCSSRWFMGGIYGCVNIGDSLPISPIRLTKKNSLLNNAGKKRARERQGLEGQGLGQGKGKGRAGQAQTLGCRVIPDRVSRVYMVYMAARRCQMRNLPRQVSNRPCLASALQERAGNTRFATTPPQSP